MKREQKKILSMFLVGSVVMVGILGFQFLNTGKVVHDSTETMDDTMVMVMDEEKMADNKTEDMMKETSIEKEEDMMAEKPMNEGPMAPNFELMDLEGNTLALKDLKGEKVYIKFWASWCPICLSGLEELDTLAGQKICSKYSLLYPQIIMVNKAKRILKNGLKQEKQKI